MDSGIMPSFHPFHGQWGEFMENTFKLSKRHADKPKHACSLVKSSTKSKGLSLNLFARERTWGVRGKATTEGFSDIFFTTV